MTRVGDEHGFTLVELLVAMAITVVVFGATLTAFDVFQKNNRVDQLRNETQDNARNAIDGLARQLRSVAAPSTETAPGVQPVVPPVFGALEQANAYSITFEAIDSSQVAGGENATNAIRLRYCLDDSKPSNEIVWKQIRHWTSKTAPALPATTSCPDLNASDWDSSTQLVQHLTNQIGGQNRPLFLYSAPEVSKIVSVEANLLIDLNPGQSPGETRLTSGISLRNANRQPIAAFTATAVAKHVLLNASESRDPDGLSLTYKWWDGSTVLLTTAEQYETPEVSGSHTYKLEVTDPGGLSNSAEQTVNVP